jgi:hypothetical protein
VCSSEIMFPIRGYHPSANLTRTLDFLQCRLSIYIVGIIISQSAMIGDLLAQM